MAEALAAARAGQGSVIVVHGPAGIGKSSLLQACAADAGDLGFRIARATANELETERPFGVARAVAQGLAGRAEDFELGEAAARALALIGGGAVRDAWAAIDGLHWLLVEVAAHDPVLVVVDDAHVADSPSQRAIGYLAARMAGTAAVLAIAVRTGPGEGVSISERLLDAPDTVSIRPRSLSATAVRRLVEHYLEGAPTEAFVESCRDATRGNPFLLNALLGELAAEDVSPDDEHAARVARLAPPGVLRSIVLRLNRLGSDATTTAHALAVLGDVPSLPLLAEVAMLPVGVVEAAVDDLALADLVTLAPGQPPAFAHPVVRSTLARAIGGPERVSLHARAATALAAAGARADRVATHLLPVPGTGDAGHVATLREAARLADQAGSPATAAAYLRRALSEPPTEDLRNRLVVEAALATARAGDPDARSVLAQAQPAIRGTGLAGVLARARAAAGDVDGAIDGLDQVLATVALSPRERRLLRVVRAELALLDPARRGEGQADLDVLVGELGATSDGAAAGAGDRAVLTMAAYLASTSSLDRTSASELARRAASGAAGDVLADLSTPTAYLLVLALRFTEELERSGELLDRLVDDATSVGSPERYARATAFRAGHHLWLGRIRDAIADGDAALAAGRGLVEPAAVLAPLCEAQLLAGDVAAARATAALTTTTGAEGRPPRASEPYARGLVALEDGDHERARDEFLRCGRIQLELGATNAVDLKWRSLAAVAAARAHDDRARDFVEEELALARRFGAPRSLAATLTAAAEVRARRSGGGDHAAARELAEEAATIEGAVDPVTRGRALLAFGWLQHADGRDSEARKVLYHALEGLEGSGADTLVTALLTAVRAAGGRPQRERTRGPAALTPSEQRIARLAADGLMNREIAERSFVSVGAVEFHLRNAFKKLGVTRRTELPDVLGAGGD